MRTFPQCLPCLMDQAVRNLQRLPESVHEPFLRRCLQFLAGADYRLSPPQLARTVFDLMEEYTGERDPYQEEKAFSNRFVSSMEEELRQLIMHSHDPFVTALKLAITGNIIDLGVNRDFSHHDLAEEIRRAIELPLSPEAIERLRQAVDHAQRILYLADNCGEIVFDKLFLEQLPEERITLAVRGEPVLNDVTPRDLAHLSLPPGLRLIDNGTNYPGTVLQFCSPEFLECWQQADLIIAKGQGNFETLEGENKHIFFLLKAKCTVVARFLGCNLGEPVIHEQVPE
ncbi:MAG: DUF89 family protein [Lentisphaerae bacterium]|nr:MAG: DUF89 family protein [Lentisphaerota bacterium]